MTPEELKIYCPRCFKQTHPSPACSQCGANARARRKANAAPLWTRLLDDRYMVGEVLGQGGFGITYAAWDDVLQQRVALKELFPVDEVVRGADRAEVEPRTSEDAEAFVYHKTKFLEESQMLVRFKRAPGIVNVENYFETNGTAYLIMEYLAGQTFEACLKARRGRLTCQEAWIIIRPVLEALEAVHAQQTPDGACMIHRDVKPQNIFITDDDRVVLLDFGNARFAGGVLSRRLTAVGTEEYAPLEQRTVSSQGPWTDVYAVGATWYRAVTGKPPPSAGKRADKDTLKPPSSKGVDLPSSVEEVWMRSLALQPKDRWPDVPSLLRALDRRPVAPGHKIYCEVMDGNGPDIAGGITPTPVLRALGGEMAGHDFQLDDRPVMLGRDPRCCQIIFTNKIISKRHCTVRYDADEGVFTVEDCGSTNGTYLAGGARMQQYASYPLRPSERFYLGNPDNLFEVTMQTQT